MNVRNKTKNIQLNYIHILVFVNCALMTLQIEIYHDKIGSDNGGIISPWYNSYADPASGFPEAVK